MADERVSVVIQAIDNATATFDKVGKGLGGLQGGFDKLVKGAALAGTALLAAGTAAAGFAAISLKKYSEVGDAVEKMSKRTGLAAESVSALRVAADASGTSIETVEMGVQLMARNMANASEVSDGMKKALEGIGSTADDLFAPGSSPDIRFEILGDAIASIQDPAQRTRMAMEAFGKSGADLIPLFEDGNFSMAAWSEQAKKLGVSFDDLAASRAARLNDAMGALNAAFLGIQLAIADALAPTVSQLLERLTPLIAAFGEIVASKMPEVLAFLAQMWELLKQKIVELQPVWEFFSNAFRMLWATIENELIPAFMHLGEVLAPYEPQLKMLGEFFGMFLVVSILAAIGAINLIIQIISKLVDWTAIAIENIVAFGKAVKDVWADIQAATDSTWKSIKNTVTGAIEAIERAIESVINAYNTASNLLSRPLGAVGAGIASVGQKLTGRASGGAVDPGRPYMVGEQGAELFMPRVAGTIIPNTGLGRAITINITGNTIASDLDMRDLANRVGMEMMRVLQSNTRV